MTVTYPDGTPWGQATNGMEWRIQGEKRRLAAVFQLVLPITSLAMLFLLKDENHETPYLFSRTSDSTA